MIHAAAANALRQTNPLPVPAAAESQPPSVLENLVATNEALIGQIAQDVLDVIHHPLDSLGHMLSNAVSPFAHPIEAVKQAMAAIEQDKVGGTVDAVANASGVAFIGALVIGTAAVLAAPVTGGASLAVAAAAFGAGDVLGVICLGADAAGLVLHEVRGALADSKQAAIEEGQYAAAFLEDGVMTAGFWVAGNALEGSVPKGMRGTRAVASVASNSIGVIGVYDAIAAPALKPNLRPTFKPVKPLKPLKPTKPFKPVKLSAAEDLTRAALKHDNFPTNG